MKKLTREEAQAELDELPDPEWFCPLINGQCNTECISFQEARMVEWPDKYEPEPLYHTVPAYCANRSINP